MKRFTNHSEEWGSFVDVKTWSSFRTSARYSWREVFIGSVTDPYQPLEAEYRRTRALLEQLQGNWYELDDMMRDYTAKLGLPYLRSDDSSAREFSAPPVIVNYFFHEEITR